VNAFAPRRLVYAHEFWYEGEEGPEYPSVWVPAWPRYEKVYRLYGAAANLANVQGEGLLRAGATEFIPRGDCYMLGTVQRQSLYPVLKEWFDIPFPAAEDYNMPKDSGLSDVRESPDYPVIAYMESLRRPSDEDILSIPPAVSEALQRRPLHTIAAEMAETLLAKARQAREPMTAEKRREVLRRDLSRVLGDIEPQAEFKVMELWKEAHSELVIEALVIESEDGILVPCFLLKPKRENGDRLPLVLALAEGGKTRFLRESPAELLELVEKGFSICIPDVRGTGETAPSQYNRGDGLALSMIELGTTLLGARLKDVRTVLEYLKRRPDIDGTRISLWGASFAPVNREPIWVDEPEGKPVAPRIQHFGSPLGSHLALLTALYHPEVQSLVVCGSLIGYLSVLEEPFVYIPADMIAPKLLQVADIADIAASLSPMPLLFSAPVTGRNFLAGEAEIAEELRPVFGAYGPQGELSLKVRHQKADMVGWLIQQR
jgi:pimeloyl-ACP methyl ester carboxylesterase